MCRPNNCLTPITFYDPFLLLLLTASFVCTADATGPLPLQHAGRVVFPITRHARPRHATPRHFSSAQCVVPKGIADFFCIRERITEVKNFTILHVRETFKCESYFLQEETNFDMLVQDGEWSLW